MRQDGILGCSMLLIDGATKSDSSISGKAVVFPVNQKVRMLPLPYSKQDRLTGVDFIKVGLTTKIIEIALYIYALCLRPTFEKVFTVVKVRRRVRKIGARCKTVYEINPRGVAGPKSICALLFHFGNEGIQISKHIPVFSAWEFWP